MSLRVGVVTEQAAEQGTSPEAIAFHHVSVLATEIVAGLAIAPNGDYLDATLGGGGHSGLILQGDPTVRLTGLDQDPQAIAAAHQHLQAIAPGRFTLIHANFAKYNPQDQRFDGIIADLGVSSAQLDQGERGFSFRQDAPLDMRMDPTQDLTAAEIINHWSAGDLADIFYRYGEERLSRRIAQRIVERRPLHSTLELADLIYNAVPGSYRHGRIHPATRTFQGLRIAVNGELTALETFLKQAPTWLKPGGRLGIISFHSLEDRLVKWAFREDERLKVLTKKPIVPGEGEQKDNPRSRSAKLRWAERWG